MVNAEKRILVVEDNNIVAQDIQRRLEKLGYSVPATARSGDAAIQRANESRPNLVLMDVKLRGEMDGIEAADIIRESLDIPVVFLTAYADEGTLERAKVTEPYGYIVKPFDENALRTNVEIGLFKHAMERKLRDSEHWLSTTLRCLGEPTLATDPQGLVRMMNPAAEKLTGWTQNAAVGLPCRDVFELNGDSGPGEDELSSIQASGAVAARRVILTNREGIQTPIDLTSASIVGESGDSQGRVFVFHDVTESEVMESAVRGGYSRLETVFEGLGDPCFLENLQGRIVVANRAACRLLGQPIEQVVGRGPEEFLGPAAANLLPRGRNLAIGSEMRQSFECALPMAGDDRIFLVTQDLCRSAESQPLGVVCVMKDVTDMNTELVTVKHEATLATVGLEIGSLAHELTRGCEGLERNLSAIDEPEQPSAEVWQKTFNEIKQEVAHIASVAGQLSELHWVARKGGDDS